MNLLIAVNNNIQEMIFRRLQYDRIRYKVVNEYVERRRGQINAIGMERKRALDEAAKFANERAEFWLEITRREIEKDLDSVLDEFKNSIKDEILHELPGDFSKIRASKKSPWNDDFNPDFYKSFDFFHQKNETK